MRRVTSLALPLVVVAAMFGATTGTMTGTASAVPATAKPSLGAPVHGKVTWYAPHATAGSCQYHSATADRYTAAANPTLYAKSAGCGLELRVTANHHTITVKVTDICPGCKKGNLDLSKQAFAALAPLSRGVMTSSYRVVKNPTMTSGLSFRVKEGSSRYWLALNVDHTGNKIKAVLLRSGSSSWRPLARTTYDHWLARDGAGAGPFSVKVTDVYGHTATAKGITLSPGKIQRTKKRLY